MTITALSQQQMLKILTKNGYNTIDDKYWDTDGVERILIGNENFSFPFKLKKFYFFPEVIKRCEMLGITKQQIPLEILEEFESCLSAYNDEKINKFLHSPKIETPKEL